MKSLALLPLLALFACRSDKEGDDSTPETGDDTGVPVPLDKDEDGFSSDTDCDDEDRDTWPGAPEQCDGADNDCDGIVDEDSSGIVTGYRDNDGDGYGDPNTTTTACTLEEGYVVNSSDCDDLDPYINPDAEELCDGADNDCNGFIDEGQPTDGNIYYADEDGDGFGDPATGTEACVQPDDYVLDPNDCDDGSAANNPDAPEVCDGEDNDCDADVDEEGAAFEDTWYADRDGDGYGDPSTTTDACSQPDGYADNADDCDDERSDVSPAAEERCDAIDNDCDGATDEDDASDAATWYADGDGDGYGLDDSTTSACSQPEGYAAYGGDCDDADTAYNPGATEDDCRDPSDYNCDGSTGYEDADGDSFAACEDCDDTNAEISPDGTERCDDADNDCDGSIDEDDAEDAPTWYADGDADSYGDPADSAEACDAPEGYVDNAADCDDGEPSTSPAGPELCDGIDNDCDDEVDEDDAWGAATWYADADDDGYGDATDSVESCAQPSGTSDNDDDCDDSTAAVNPGEVEVCDDLDNDCNTVVDDSATDARTWYQDADADSYGDPDVSVAACDRPTGFKWRAKDCDDSDADVNPAAEEVCDGVDNDCDDTIDGADATDADTFYEDADGDGWGDDGSTTLDCEAPGGYVEDGGDCDDGDTAYNPAASEADCADPNDYNCDGSVGYADEDGDGYAACEDCDDESAEAFPGGDEICDGLDNDCDGTVDGGAADPGTWYADADRDGYGDDSTLTETCEAPRGYVSTGGDCDDANDETNPAAEESCDDLDNDCDGDTDEEATDATTWYLDSDKDNYGDPAVSTEACDKPSGYKRNDDDCDDSDKTVSPGATETCDGEDDDCDGVVDDGATGGTTWYGDADGDGYAGEDTTTTSCAQPDGYSATVEDCDDTDASVSPGASETCDGEDEDCDGTIDDGATGGDTWYADVDGDGYGGADDTTISCAQPDGYLSDSTDCDDGDDAIYPGAGELCDGADNDCDGSADEAPVVSGDTFYADEDGDGYGGATTVEACVEEDGWTAASTDCDDADASVSPGAVELVDGEDDDCDGTTDEASVLLITGYQCTSLTSSSYASAETTAIEDYLTDMSLGLDSVSETSSGFDGSVTLTDYDLVLFTKCGPTWRSYNEATALAMLDARDQGVATFTFDHDMAAATSYIDGAEELVLMSNAGSTGRSSSSVTFDTAEDHAAYAGPYGTPADFTYSYDVDRVDAADTTAEALAWVSTDYPAWVVQEDESGWRASTMLMGVYSSDDGTVANRAGLSELEIMFKNTVAWLLEL